MKFKYLVIAISHFIVLNISAQGKFSLLEMEKLKEFLNFNNEQEIFVSEKINQINLIIKKDENIISEIKQRVKNDDEPGFFEKIEIKLGHDKRASQIENLIDEIENELTPQQKIKFQQIEKPKLREIKKEDVFGK
ncbi:MAG: hypothetical protein IPM32_18630 [Ignavibacteriae bacterium]|nr:hypothetical protein [Ignavibacteriota bacterium]